MRASWNKRLPTFSFEAGCHAPDGGVRGFDSPGMVSPPMGVNNTMTQQ